MDALDVLDEDLVKHMTYIHYPQFDADQRDNATWWLTLRGVLGRREFEWRIEAWRPTPRGKWQFYGQFPVGVKDIELSKLSHRIPTRASVETMQAYVEVYMRNVYLKLITPLEPN